MFGFAEKVYSWNNPRSFAGESKTYEVRPRRRAGVREWWVYRGEGDRYPRPFMGPYMTRQDAEEAIW